MSAQAWAYLFALVMLLIGVASLAAALLIIRLHYVRAHTTQAEATQVLGNARREADQLKREGIAEAKEEAVRIRNEAQSESRERRSELQRTEKRLVQKDENLERRLDQLERREKKISGRERELDGAKDELAQTLDQQRRELERISGIPADEARQQLMQRVEAESRQDAARLAKQIEDEAREKATEEAKKIIALSIQRCAADHVAETTVSVVPLPSDDMKGRIIGREGRNIRSFESLTGVDLVIDDTPEAVVLSCFDPIRREVARAALTTLVSDGRIHPRRIEETVEKAKQDVEQAIREAGEKAVLEAGIVSVHPEIVRLLGRLKYRTSYGQNVLDHLVECAHLAGMMAAELKVNVGVAKRGALLHDIGKAVDSNVEGSHTDIGLDLARRLGESEAVLNAIAAHHRDTDFASLEAVLVHVADVLSAGRPGARRETLEAYLKRVQNLEEIADSCPGVEKSYAIQAGREVRIIVKPEVIDDLAAAQLAKDVAKRIEEFEGLQYPGLIKVTVIRETRATEYAK
jgi:ribonuclease Y